MVWWRRRNEARVFHRENGRIAGWHFEMRRVPWWDIRAGLKRVRYLRTAGLERLLDGVERTERVDKS